MKKNKKKFFAFFVFTVFCFSIFSKEKTALEHFEEGINFQNTEEWYKASQSFMEAIQKNPVYSDAWFHLAQSSYQLGEFDLVLNQLDEAEKYSNNDSSIKNLRGMTLIAMEDFDGARKIFEDVLKQFPNNVDARFGLAELNLFNGRLSGAEKQYTEALKRQSENRKALLSLAIVSSQLGKNDNAERYIQQALILYSNEAEVHYLAAIINALKGDIKAAEMQCRVAVECNGNYYKAYELLAKIRYQQKEYNDVIDYCDFIIGRERNNSIAWYLKGSSLMATSKPLQAIDVWSMGLKINPQDEIMRAALELAVNDNIPLEDEKRKEWASFHIQTAREYEKRYDNQGATYEYQRALKIEPANQEARMNFAKMLEMNGLHENYLDQLLFIQQTREENSLSKQKEIKMNDTIEAYQNLLQDSLAKKWNVQPFYLDKTRWSLGIYYIPSSLEQAHVENNKIASAFACDMFSGLASTAVQTSSESVQGFGDAYQKARLGNKDYFVILSVSEGHRDITLTYTMYSARTGSKILENSLYSTGNNKYSSIFRRFRSEILGKLTVRGNIINRDGKTLLIDLGKSENIRDGAVFDIVRKNSIQTASSGSGVVYKDSDILGDCVVTTTGEDVSECILNYKGFYDRINTGDEIVLISLPKSDEENALQAGETIQQNDAQNVPSSDANGNPLNRNLGLTAEDLGARRNPSFIDLIRSIY